MPSRICGPMPRIMIFGRWPSPGRGNSPAPAGGPPSSAPCLICAYRPHASAVSLSQGPSFGPGARRIRPPPWSLSTHTKSSARPKDGLRKAGVLAEFSARKWRGHGDTTARPWPGQTGGFRGVRLPLELCQDLLIEHLTHHRTSSRHLSRSRRACSRAPSEGGTETAARS